MKYSFSIHVQENGKILLATSNGWDMILTRLQRNLRPDPSMGPDGTLFVDFSAHNINPSDVVAVQPDGKILVSGMAYRSTGDTDFVLARLLPNGRLDPGFGERGLAVAWEGRGFYSERYYEYRSHLRTAAVQPDGTILAGVWTSTGGYSPTAYLVRYTKDGALDTSYGNQGRAQLWSGSRFHSWVDDIVLEPDGQAVAVGSHAGAACLLGRVSQDGQTVTVRNLIDLKLNNSIANPMQVVRQRDGKLLLSGCTRTEREYWIGGDRVVARLKADLTLDLTFGQEGMVQVPDHYGVLVQPSGKVIVGRDTLTRLRP